MIILGSNKGEDGDNDEQWITVQDDDNNALDQKSIATKQHCEQCLVLGFLSFLTVVLLGNS